MLQNRVREISHSVGTSTFNLEGRIDATFVDFVSAFGDGNKCFYSILSESSPEYELGIGTVHLGSPNTLTRTTVLESSNGGSLVNFSAGSKQIFNAIPAEFFAVSSTANYVPKASSNGKIDNGWLRNSIGYDYYNIITYASSLNIDMNNGTHQFVTLTGNPTISFSNFSSNGDFFTLVLKQDGTGGRTVTWPGTITWPSGAVQPNSAANSVSYFDFIKLSTGAIYFRQFSSGGGGGGGGVSGPLSTTVDAIAAWNATDGSLLRNTKPLIHSAANDKLEYIASFSNIYTLTSSDLTSGNSDRLLPTSDGGNNGWTSTASHLWNAVNKLVPGGTPGTGYITSPLGANPIILGMGPLTYTPTNCSLKLWIGTGSSGSTVSVTVHQTVGGGADNLMFHSSSTNIPVSGGAELDITLTADNPMVPGYDLYIVLTVSAAATVTVYGVELDTSTSSGIMVMDLNQADKFYWLANAYRNFEFDNYSVGQVVILSVTQNSTGYFKPTFINCTMKWNGDHDPFFYTPPNTWVSMIMFCESIDIYGRPTFKELSRRSSVRYDDLSYRVGAAGDDTSGLTVGMNLDVYLLNANVTLPDPTVNNFGKKITLINATTVDSSHLNGSNVTITGNINSNFFNLSGSYYGPSTSWLLPGYMDYVTILATSVGWTVIDDGRRNIQSGYVITGTDTIPPSVTYVQCNNTSAATLTLSTYPKYGSLIVNSINVGTVTVAGVTLRGGQVGVFIYDGSSWRLISTTDNTFSSIKKIGYQSLAASADTFTGNGANKTFSNSVTLPTNWNNGDTFKFRASGNFTVGSSGQVNQCGFTLSNGGTDIALNCSNYTYVYGSASSGSWIVEGEFIVRSSTKIEQLGTSDFQKSGSVSSRSANNSEVTISVSTQYTMKVFINANTGVVLELRTLSVEME